MPQPLRFDRDQTGAVQVPSRAPLGYVNAVETFALVDGPGVRYLVLMQGCKLRCRYCHNPETWALEGGAECSAEDLFSKAWRYHNYWSNNGGVTVGGGEPLLQMDFVAGFFELLKERGVHTALDTAGAPYCEDPTWQSGFQRLMEACDLVLLDMKCADSERHRKLTGHSNENILAMARHLSDMGKPMWIRHVLVPGITDDRENLCAIKAFVDSLDTVERVEVLPYSCMAQLKWEACGLSYPLAEVPEPDQGQVDLAESILCR